MTDYYSETHSGSFWRKRGDQPLLNRSRLRSAKRRSPSWPGRLLDLGSGEGYFVGLAQRKGWTAVGLEPDRIGADRTSSLLGPGLTVQGDATSLPFRLGSFDVVTAWDVLEHVGDPVALLREVRRIIRPRGCVLASTPNPAALSVKRRGLDSTQFRDQTHVSILPRPLWERYFRAAGFSEVAMGGDAWWDPPYFGRPVDVLAKPLSQLLFASRMSWPFDSTENTVIVATA